MKSSAADGMFFTTERHISFLAEYDRRLKIDSAQVARDALIGVLSGSDESDWLACARALVLRGAFDAVVAILTAALCEHSDSLELRRSLAGAYRQARRNAEAEALLCEILLHHPDDAAATFLLVRMLKEQGRMHAAAVAMRALFAQRAQDTELTIQAIELLDDCDRKLDAAIICEAAIAAGAVDPRLHAYAGMLALQLGEFHRARTRYTFAVDHSHQALEWFAPHGLASAQRYDDRQHGDFQLFREWMLRTDLSTVARASLLFALGKAHDDIGDYARAAGYFRNANQLRHAGSAWSRKLWRRSIDARLQPRPLAIRHANLDWTPIFVVGVPRSGTTLVAELLSRYSRVCNRGELRSIWMLSQKLPDFGSPDLALLDTLAAEYEAQLRQDDAGDARWFIDKQPLNLLHIDMIMALWPHAKIIYCQRNTRDTALSLWMQFFIEDTHAYAYDFGDIAAVMQGCSRMMKHWHKSYAASIYSLPYEDVVANRDESMAALAEWLGWQEGNSRLADKQERSSISTASLWQARQPVYTRSVGRWQAYVPYLPELGRIPDD